MKTTPDEAALIERLRAGDDAAFMQLMEAYGATLLRLARLYVDDPAAAEDVVQETWLGVFRGIDRFEGRSSLKTWLFTILTNRAKRRGARESRTLPFSSLAARAGGEDAEVDLDRFFPPGHDDAGYWVSIPDDWGVLPEARIDSAETRAAIERAIAALPAVQRQVITLRDIDGWTSEEVRNALALTETNQRVLLHRARTKVRRALEEELAS
ncbi:MAG: sigma-70 family RNA polymerase sigma factor [Thermomicrobiales bacterium]|nr:sigma-70 family RNA polymerase sigma factor [Thermomicrobiales bacterium]